MKQANTGAVAKSSIQTISVIVPANPFIRGASSEVKHCLAALDAVKLMEWWPGKPHAPHRNSDKVRAIQRSLDWKRVCQIAAYLLQRDIVDAPGTLDKYFKGFYESKSREPGREWPPRVPPIIKFQRSEYPTFSNVLLHVNGATIHEIRDGAAKLKFDENSRDLNFFVIDGQHRVNGAYLAISLLREDVSDAEWQIPSEIFLNLDNAGEPPRRQAQIFIDVNFYQKKVDRSLVADLFPTARGAREPLDNTERAQDIGRKLMLEIGPLVGMIQIPGIKYGVKDVVTLATLNTAIEDILDDLCGAGIDSLELQAEFLALCIAAWLEATHRRQEIDESGSLDGDNVAYQGRVIVSFLTLIPACISELQKGKVQFVSDKAQSVLQKWLRGVMERAGVIEGEQFLAKEEFKKRGYLGSGGLARFRDTLWAAVDSKGKIRQTKPDRLEKLAKKSRARVGLRLRLHSAN